VSPRGNTSLFSGEDFETLIRKTFDDYYKEDFNRATVDVDYFCKMIETTPEWDYFRIYLADSNQNIINNRTVPWLDIGDLPPTYNFNRTAPHQTFLTPEHNPPDQFFVNYSEWLDGYIVNLDKLFECLSSLRKR